MFTFIQKEAAKKHLQSLGTESMPHVKGKSLYQHFVRVGEMLESWGLPDQAIIAGMCHSLYSTEFYTVKTLEVSDREQLRKRIGEEAEELVFILSSIVRRSLKKHADGFQFDLRDNKGTLVVDEKKGKELLHILLANDLDHVTHMNVGFMSTELSKSYGKWKEYLTDEVREKLEEFLVSSPSLEEGEMVRFIAHAGVQIKNKSISVVIDPWIYASGRSTPVLQGLDPEAHTIDYLIPEPINTMEDIASDIVILSHLHTHHSPLREIAEMAQLKKITIVCPKLDEKKVELIRKSMGEDVFANLSFHFIEGPQECTIKGVTIRAFKHAHPDHFAYLVKVGGTSVLHMADISTSETFNSLTFEPFWEHFYDLRPDFLFIAAGGHGVRVMDKHGNRDILEVGMLTPVLAAKATAKIKPKHVGIIGIYNFSVWDNRMEYAGSVGEIEAEFFWAMSYLRPSVKVLNLKPGNAYFSYPHTPPSEG